MTCDHDYRLPGTAFHPFEGFGWAISSKWPIANLSGGIIGLTGITRKVDSSGRNGEVEDFGQSRLSGIDRLSGYIREHMDRTLTNEEMARISGLSIRQLIRQLHETYGMTPRNFAAFTRICSSVNWAQAACSQTHKRMKLWL